LTQDTALARQILLSGILHAPLPLDASRSFEAFEQQKTILDQRSLRFAESLDGWTLTGIGHLDLASQTPFSDGSSLKMTFPTSTNQRAIGSPDDPDYATYGHCRIQKTIHNENWEDYNRIAFAIYPDCDGAQVVNLNFSFHNADTQLSPGANRHSASHLINLKNKQWNYCFLNLDEFQRNRVSHIGFSCSIKGRDRTTGPSSTFYINRFELQRITPPAPVSGWIPASNNIIYTTSGYESTQSKTAIVRPAPVADFRLIDAKTGRTAFRSTLRTDTTSLGAFGILDFSAFKRSGLYRLQWGQTITPPFPIGAHLWENSIWRTLNFIFGQRCGYPVPGIHAACHLDLYSSHLGHSIPYAGGWHDAGDLSQQTLQTGDLTFALLESYQNQKEKNPLLAQRLLEEARWGLEFITRNRYGDGYRASSMGLLLWQDDILGTLDDISSVRVQNLAFDNFLYAAYEAYAALAIDDDPALRHYLTTIAREDFKFALQKHNQSGFGGFLHLYEHSYNTSQSQYQATRSWAASLLYQLTSDPIYAEQAAQEIRYALQCQRQTPLDDPNRTSGFFYRDHTRQSIVHFIHQSREQVYMQALILLCKTQPQHPDFPLWQQAIRLYGDYLKSLMPYTAPYGMLPSGIYHIDEHRDSDSFNHLHLFPPANAASLYVEQVQKGVRLDAEHYLRRFPVWFGIFNGNTAVHLSMGKSAALCGHFLNDETLLQIGRLQMEWVVGKNPFGQSLIYGEGYNYPQMDSFSSGEITGEMPVGIRSLNNDDIPYWPQTNDACYKEVWVTSAGKWLSLQAEY
jgi:hypothetical protein